MKFILFLRDFLGALSATCTSVFRIFVFSSFHVKINKTAQKSKAFVLANGPSLKKMIEEHKERLDDGDLICVNSFPVTSLYEELKPKYTIISAPEFWIDNVDDIYIKNRTELYNALIQKTQWEMEFIVPSLAKKYPFWQDALKQNKHIKIVFYNVAPVEGWRWFRHLMFRLQLGMPRPHNILAPSIYFLLEKGYKEIYLWGADHSWLSEISVNEQNVALVCQKHFYNENSAIPEKMRLAGVGARRLHEILHKFMHTFASYFVLKEYADSKQAHIINNTPGSFIDAFDREIL